MLDSVEECAKIFFASAAVMAFMDINSLDCLLLAILAIMGEKGKQYSLKIERSKRF
jgi:hypothetical protein